MPSWAWWLGGVALLSVVALVGWVVFTDAGSQMRPTSSTEVGSSDVMLPVGDSETSLEPVTGIRAEVKGDQVVFSWSYPARQGLQFEVVRTDAGADQSRTIVVSPRYEVAAVGGSRPCIEVRALVPGKLRSDSSGSWCS